MSGYRMDTHIKADIISELVSNRQIQTSIVLQITEIQQKPIAHSEGKLFLVLIINALSLELHDCQVIFGLEFVTLRQYLNYMSHKIAFLQGFFALKLNPEMVFQIVSSDFLHFKLVPIAIDGIIQLKTYRILEVVVLFPLI